MSQVLRVIKEAVRAPAKPQKNHYVENWRGDVQKVATASRGYVYCDTGGPTRDTYHMSELTYKGPHKGSHLWKES